RSRDEPGGCGPLVDSVEPRRILVGYDERPAWTRRPNVVEWWEPRVESSPAPESHWAQPAEELAAISFTSGTTGQPKGCMISHANLCSQVEAAFQVIPIDATCRLASILPLSHLFELTCGISIRWPPARPSTTCRADAARTWCASCLSNAS